MSTTYTPTPTELTTITLLADTTDDRSAASVNVPMEALADAIALLQNEKSGYRLVDIAIANDQAATELASNDTNSYATGTAGAIFDGSGTAHPILTGDILEVDVTFHAETAATNVAEFAVKVGGYKSSLNYAANESIQTAEGASAQETRCYSAHVAFVWTGASNGELTLYLQCRWVIDPGAQFVKIYRPYTATVKIWRANT